MIRPQCSFNWIQQCTDLADERVTYGQFDGFTDDLCTSHAELRAHIEWSAGRPVKRVKL